MHLRTKLLTIFVGAFVAWGLVQAPAFANPPFNPTLADYGGVGDWTTQNAMDVLAADYNALPNVTRRLANWADSGNPDGTLVKPGCAVPWWPSGSEWGIQALRFNQKSTVDSTTYCVDFARSSRALRTTETPLSQYVLGRDGVSWAKDNVSNAPPSNLTVDDLNLIYTCDPSARNWAEFGGANAPIVPVLPQTYSGTRVFFLQSIGVTNPGECVETGAGPEYQENQGLLVDGKPNSIAPYSIANWVAQSNGVIDDERFGAVLGQANGTLPVVNGEFNANGSTGVQRFTDALQRDVYNIVRTTQRSVFDSIFGSAGYACTADGKARVQEFGFADAINRTTNTSRCGEVTDV